MNRSPTLMDLGPGQVLWVSERQLGVFFCNETFAFVLNPRTRAAAERVARWHGCRFQFNPANGSAAFLKRSRASALLVSSVERVAMRCGHALRILRTALPGQLLSEGAAAQSPAAR